MSDKSVLDDAARAVHTPPMILDHLTNAPVYHPLSPRLAAGFHFLRTADLRALPPGRTDLPDGLFALLQDYDTKPVDQGFFESHRKYIDIQCVVTGAERIAHAPTDTLRIATPFDDAADLIKYAPAAAPLWLTLGAGTFAVFFPHDGHMPGISLPDSPPAPVRKVVVKVPV